MTEDIKPEAVKRLLEEGRADELEDETSKMSKTETDAFLEKAGVTKDDRKAMLERQRARFEEARKKAPAQAAAKAAPADTRATDVYRRLRAWALAGWVSLLGLFGTLAGMLGSGQLQFASNQVATTTAPTGTATTTGAPTGAPPTESASDLRYHALEAYALHRWAECVDGLNRARALDPTGDAAPAIAAARRDAEAHLPH